jgi:hypothetical protein
MLISYRFIETMSINVIDLSKPCQCAWICFSLILSQSQTNPEGPCISTQENFPQKENFLNVIRRHKFSVGEKYWSQKSSTFKAHFHSRKISTNGQFSENIIVKSWKFSTSKIFSDGKFVSANHILQNFLSAENFPERKWAFSDDIFCPWKFFLSGN